MGPVQMLRIRQYSYQLNRSFHPPVITTYIVSVAVQMLRIRQYRYQQKLSSPSMYYFPNLPVDF